jgi:hypothetical protein
MTENIDQPGVAKRIGSVTSIRRHPESCRPRHAELTERLETACYSGHDDFSESECGSTVFRERERVARAE